MKKKNRFFFSVYLFVCFFLHFDVSPVFGLGHSEPVFVFNDGWMIQEDNTNSVILYGNAAFVQN